MANKVHLVGKGPGWSLAPRASEGHAVWGINDMLRKRTDLSMIFELHDWTEKFVRPVEGWIHNQYAIEAGFWGVPYMVREYWPWFGDIEQIVYPWDEIFKYFRTEYIGCTLDAMIAYAIYKGYDDITLYGMGQMRGSGYDYQLDSIAFWVGYCYGAKIPIRQALIGDKRHSEILVTHDKKVYGLRKPQSGWDFYATMEECSCLKGPHNRMCRYTDEYLKKKGVSGNGRPSEQHGSGSKEIPKLAGQENQGSPAQETDEGTD